MSVSCGRYIDALWSNEEESNAWVWPRNSGWRKLDDRNKDACTNLLAIAAEAKRRQRAISVHGELGGDRWYIKEVTDDSTEVVERLCREGKLTHSLSLLSPVR
ncbi:hypothetical protein SAMN06298226_3153 [Nitrosovibrio sp. Nv4]|nr:hypothetical protein SAMN06298226_3153 [Nitrosovibrio sp. Nv4]